MRRWCLLALVAAGVAAGAMAQDGEPGMAAFTHRKVIKLYGWERPDTAGLRANVEVIKRAGFDGLGVNVMPNGGIPDALWGRDGNYLWFGAHPFKREDFTNAISDLNATDMGRLTDNFIHVAARGTKTVGFFSTGWPTVVENARVLGWVAGQAGLRGITLDVEEGFPFSYVKSCEGEHSFEEAAAQARTCGKEYMEALCEEAPGIAVWLTHGYWAAACQMERDGLGGIEETDYALLPAFIDGLLEGASGDAVVIDGCEITYPYICYKTFADFVRRTEAQALALTSAGDLYRKRMRRALALWTGFPKAFESMAGDPQGNHFSPKAFEHAVSYALSLSDEYVWVWSGANVWWPVTMSFGGQRKTFAVPEVYVDALARGRTPHPRNWAPAPPDRGEHRRLPELPDALGDLEETYETLMPLPSEWWFRTDPGAHRPEHMDDFDGWLEPQSVGLNEELSGWRRISTDACWESQGVPYDGAAWYRVKFSTPVGAHGRRVWACLPMALGEVKAYAACEGRGPAVCVTPVREGERVMLPLTGMTAQDKWTFIAMRVYSPKGPGGIAGAGALVGRRGDTPAIITGKRVLVDLDMSNVRQDTVPDQSGLGNDATVHGAAKSARGLRFDGNDDHVDCGNDVSLIPGGNEISWEIVFSPVAEQGSGARYHILAGKHPSYLNGLYLDYGLKPNRIVFIQGADSGAPRFVIGDYARFYHVVATYDGAVMTLHVDGEAVGTKRTPIPPVANDVPLVLAGGGRDVPRATACDIRAFRLYNYCLDPQEVRERFQEQSR